MDVALKLFTHVQLTLGGIHVKMESNLPSFLGGNNVPWKVDFHRKCEKHPSNERDGRLLSIFT